MQASLSADLQALQKKHAASALAFDFETSDSGIDLHFSQAKLKFQHSFLVGGFARRALQSNQALLKACSNKQGSIKTLLDMTAGWGMDSLSLASHGKRVTMLEHNPLIQAIVAWSLQCLATDAVGSGVAAGLSLQQAHALDFLRASESSFDCIYLDPMFPPHKSSAKPAKAMQLLQSLTENRDMDACIELALQKARNRVVIKRPAKAAALIERKPDLVYREKTVRFDVYLTK